MTASNFKEGDSLISEGAEVVVRAAPRLVELEGAVQGRSRSCGPGEDEQPSG